MNQLIVDLQMYSMLQKVQETPGILFQIMDKAFTIAFIKKILINIFLFIFFNIGIIAFNISCIRKTQEILVDNYFFRKVLPQKINDRQIESYVIFEDTANAYCVQQNDNKENCQNMQKYGNKIELSKGIYDFQLEMSLFVNERQENFVYEIFVAMKDKKDNFVYEGFIIPEKRSFLQSLTSKYFSNEDVFFTKQFSFDFRNNYKPQYAVFKLKMIQSQTFIKDLVFNYKKKASFLIHILYNYRYLLYIAFFFIVISVANSIYFAIIFAMYGYQFLNFIQNLDNEDGYISVKEKAI